MTGEDGARREEWDRLRAERAAARHELLAAFHAVEVRARDPFGLKEKFRRHPAVAAGIAAGVGAILVNLLIPRGSRGRAPERGDEAQDGRPRPSFADSLRDAALRVATPWITRFVAEHFGGHADVGDDAEDDPAPRHAP